MFFGSLPGLAKFPRPTLQPTLGRPLRGRWKLPSGCATTGTPSRTGDARSKSHHQGPDSQLTHRLQTSIRDDMPVPTKRGWPPTYPATQRANLPNPWRCSSFPINGRPSTAPQGSPTSLELLWRHAHKETSSCGEPARPGRRDAGGIFADGHPPHGPITGGALSLARLGGASNQYAAS